MTKVRSIRTKTEVTALLKTLPQDAAEIRDRPLDAKAAETILRALDLAPFDADPLVRTYLVEQIGRFRSRVAFDVGWVRARSLRGTNTTEIAPDVQTLTAVFPGAADA